MILRANVWCGFTQTRNEVQDFLFFSRIWTGKHGAIPESEEEVVKVEQGWVDYTVSHPKIKLWGSKNYE